MGDLTAQTRRIILTNGARLLLEMLKRAIDKASGLQVVGEITDLARLPSVIEQTGAQWVIMAFPPEGEMPEMAESLLTAYPSVRIMAVATDGSQVTMKWLESHERTLDGLSLDELIAVLRRGSPGELVESNQ